MKLLFQTLLLSVELSACAVTPLPVAERLAAIARRVEVGG